MKALLLFAHGARDPHWALPFLSIRDRLRAQGLLVELGFLELMTPNLEDAARQLREQGADHIMLVPLFLGQGSHIRRDLPQQVQTASEKLGFPIEIGHTIGQSETVLKAIADECLVQFQSA